VLRAYNEYMDTLLARKSCCFHISYVTYAMADLHQNFWGAKIIYSKFIYLILLWLIQ